MQRIGVLDEHDTDADPDALPDMNVTIYKNDMLRILSFTNWTNSAVSRESLALAGFFYVGESQLVNSDRVKCAWCGGELFNWILGDCPLTEHVKHFPNCQYAKTMADKNNITISQISNDDLLSNNMEELGIQAHKPAVRPEFSFLKVRLDTYVGWPETNPQKPEPLAMAGFYYSGINDQVKCFHCNVTLSKWEPSDDPWVEHARWSPGCSFVALMQSKDFIEKCVKIGNTRNNDQSNNIRNNSRIPPVSDAVIEEQMNGPFAQVALSCGIQPERIRSAIRRKFAESGVPFQSANSLIEGALDAQVNETPFNIPESTPSLEYACSSSTRYPVNDAAVDQVTRMIISSVLSGEGVDPLSSMISSDLESNDDDNETSVNIEPSIAPEVENEQNMILSEDNNKIDDVSQPIESEESELQETKNKSSFLLERENKLLRDARTCKICMDAEVSVVFLPCGHLVSCIVCASGLSQCPICRANVKGIVRTYLS